VWASAVPTFGVSVVLSPLGALLTVVAWRRSPHDALFWIGAVLNGILILWLLVVVTSLATGEAAIGDTAKAAGRR